LIAAGCDAILVPAAMISPAKVAEICDPEGVYWGTFFYKFEEGTEDYEAAMNSEYFVGTTYEDDVDSAYWATSVLGKLGQESVHDWLAYWWYYSKHARRRYCKGL